jgi:hypothetical protein
MERKYQGAGYRGNTGGTVTDLLPLVTPLLSPATETN